MPVDPLTDNLLQERSRIEGRLLSIKDNAADQRRDLTEDELGALDKGSERMSAIDAQLERSTRDFTQSEEIRGRIATITPGRGAVTGAYRTAGALLWDVLHQNDPDAQARYRGIQRRAAEHMGTDAANTVAVAGGWGGLVVSPVSGPIIDLHDYSMPFLNLIGARQAPDALSFRRPRIVDANFQTGVARQDKEKQELASKAFNLLSDTLELVTYGGYLNVSQQLQSYDSNALDVIVGQLNRRLSAQLEGAAVAAAALGAPDIGPVDMTDGAAVRSAIYDASAQVYANTGSLATWVAMGPDGWAALGSVVDLAHRPLFPSLGPSNAMGTSSPGSFVIGGLGLTGVVTSGIDDGTLYVGNTTSVEAYVYRYPVLEAVEPSLLGRQVAVAASIATYKPPTTEAGPSDTPPAAYESVVRITAAP